MTTGNLQYQILGSVMPMLELSLKNGQKVYSQAGAMQWMDANVKMETGMKGGMFGALKRSVSGEGMFLTYFSGLAEDSRVAFGHTYPGNIIPLYISQGNMICQRRSFLCAEESVDYGLYIQKKLGTGFFGGEGLFLTTLTGPGKVWLQTMPVQSLSGELSNYLPSKN